MRRHVPPPRCRGKALLPPPPDSQLPAKSRQDGWDKAPDDAPVAVAPILAGLPAHPPLAGMFHVSGELLEHFCSWSSFLKAAESFSALGFSFWDTGKLEGPSDPPSLVRSCPSQWEVVEVNIPRSRTDAPMCWWSQSMELWVLSEPCPCLKGCG